MEPFFSVYGRFFIVLVLLNDFLDLVDFVDFVSVSMAVSCFEEGFGSFILLLLESWANYSLKSYNLDEGFYTGFWIVSLA